MSAGRLSDGISSEGSRRALCIGVGSFIPVGTDDRDEPDLTPFEGLDYAAECTRELHAALREAGYDSDLVIDPAVLQTTELGERVEQHLSGGGVAVMHVLSHGDHTSDGGVYVVGSDVERSWRTRVEDWRIRVNDGRSAPMTLSCWTCATPEWPTGTGNPRCPGLRRGPG